MNKTYVLMTFSHKSFKSGKIAIIEMEYKSDYIPDYFECAKEKVCEKFNLNKEEITVLDFSYIGTDICFISEENKFTEQVIDLEDIKQKVITNIFGEDIVFDVTEYNKLCDVIEETLKIYKKYHLKENDVKKDILNVFASEGTILNSVDLIYDSLITLINKSVKELFIALLKNPHLGARVIDTPDYLKLESSNYIIYKIEPRDKDNIIKIHIRSDKSERSS